jgi:hypothetical protein
MSREFISRQPSPLFDQQNPGAMLKTGRQSLRKTWTLSHRQSARAVLKNIRHNQEPIPSREDVTRLSLTLRTRSSLLLR